ncbi:MAG: membrane protein insertase YidC, partial [Myxococcales bacterium]|nr:membrane protein insertase YidC [Myxococcales bacterium]
GDDREKKGAAVMELYRKNKVNPVGGCLPQLLQMPVWIAFYASLSTNTELYRAEFILHWTDLSAPDPLYTLPVLLGALMYFQQKLTPTTMDPAQAKMMLYFMPIMMSSVFFFLPSGLCLYAVTNSVLTFGQQHLIFRRMENEAPESASDGPEQSENDADDGDEPDPSGLDSSSRPHNRSRRKTTKRRNKRG